jgi:hypothetical protein
LHGGYFIMGKGVPCQKSVHVKHVRGGFESLLTFEAKSGDFAVPCGNLCVHTKKMIFYKTLFGYFELLNR